MFRGTKKEEYLKLSCSPEVQWLKSRHLYIALKRDQKNIGNETQECKRLMNKHLGESGTLRRDKYEAELKLNS